MDTELQRVLLVMAHPDDAEFSCGGTLAKWAREGKEVRYLLLTCGDKGSDGPDVTPEMLCADRQAEQRAAAAVIGVKEVVFLHNLDGELVNTPEVRQYFIAQGNDPVANTPAEFAKVIKADADKWGAIGKRIGVKLD